MNLANQLFASLSGDAWRVGHPFSEDVLQANAVLHNRAATEEEMAECVGLWCLRRQTCQFGKVAANEGRIHFCFLSEDAVSTWTDEEISEKIADEKKLWKQRAAFDPSRGGSSFVLIVAAPRVALAAPDAHLRAFSDHILKLAGWGSERRGARTINTIAHDLLYLTSPAGEHFGFRFNVDFFACAGEGRWWRDHRFPGGIAFTANSPGHMIALRDWYQGKSDGFQWALKQAMLTVDNAVPTRETNSENPEEQGRATWLRSLDEQGRPLVDHVACPLSRVPGTLEGKDWTRYEGVLHTDHAVRAEFFMDRPAAPTSGRPYLMDFTYLYDASQPDFREFTEGVKVSKEQIYSEIGRPEDWTHRGALPQPDRSLADVRALAEQLETCRRWGSTTAEIDDA